MSTPWQRIRPSDGSARGLIIRSSVDLPAPERPITPTKPPGAIENDALSTAAFVPKRHVKPSTTSMQDSDNDNFDLSLATGFYSDVTIMCWRALYRAQIRATERR